MTTTTNRDVLKMTKAQLIDYITGALRARGEISVTGFRGWSKDELQREALDHVDPLHANDEPTP